ncbi:putative adp-ribosylation factor [Paratrimastix pyriformis]|uniref:Adp-ribosylation factor n=1 Tax=Paratrimastix pyriformis TaxID=342808 RepID=A0ABQ8U713_9EUKA|nr:putative adp-ribosylation factor [Paratrimastix pyriformis]QXF29084.1 Arf1e [Paratrimastix pyriformis]
MGNMCFEDLSGKKESHILMVGLDAAGKTTILHKLKVNAGLGDTAPTIGALNLEELELPRARAHLRFLAYDISDHTRELYREYYSWAHAIVFVVDSNDRSRIACPHGECNECARDLLRTLLRSADLHRDAPLLVFANKQDLPGAMCCRELRERLELDNITQGRQWLVQACSALTGDGFEDGIESLIKALRHQKA